MEQELRDAGLRVEGDYRAEKMGYKIREAQLEKIPTCSLWARRRWKTVR